MKKKRRHDVYSLSPSVQICDIDHQPAHRKPNTYTTWKVNSDKANKRWRLRWQQQLQNVLTFAAPGQQ